MIKRIDSFSGEYRWLSNFWPCKIKLHYMALEFDSTEAAYQAAKCANPEDRKKFVGLKPGEAKRLGQTVELAANWNEDRLRVMKMILQKKFEDPILKQKLLDTGRAILIEGNNWNDTFWGKCKGVGENHLGKLLTEVRQELFEEYYSAKLPDVEKLLVAIMGTAMNADDGWLLAKIDNGEEVSPERILEDYRQASKGLGSIYRIVHAYLSPGCNQNHPGWFDELLKVCEENF